MKPKRYYFILLGTLVALIAGGVAGYYYATQLLQQKSQAYQQVAATQIVAVEHLDQLVSLKKQFLALQPKLAKVDLALPKVKKQSEVALQLQQLANGSGMTISAISFSGGASGQSLPSATSQTIAVGNATALPITFQLTGTYEQLQTFLQKLEQLNRYTNVSSLSISRTTSNKLTFSLTVNAFIKP